MTMKFLTLALALAGVAAVVYVKKNPPGRRALDAGGRGKAGAPGHRGNSTGNWMQAGFDSPNQAERLQDLKLGGAGAGVGSAMSAAGHDDLLAPSASNTNVNNKAEDPDAITPGLPDFARGA